MEIISEFLLITSINVHHVDFKVSIPIRRKGKPFHRLVTMTDASRYPDY